MLGNQLNKSKAAKACVWLILFAIINDLKLIQCAGSERILSRKRRYITFPKGSAIQLGSYHYIVNQITYHEMSLICLISLRYVLSDTGE